MSAAATVWTRPVSAVTFALALGALFAAGVSGAPRVVLFEESTNYGCPPCATYNPGIHQVLVSFGEQVAPVKWHVWWPDPADPFYNHNPSPVDQRIAYYGINAAPDIVVDGVNGPSPASPSGITTFINSRLAVPSEVALSCSGQVTGGGAQVSIDLDVETPLVGDYRLFCVLVEEHIPLVSPNGETDHYDVFRRANNNNVATGQSIDISVAGPQHFDVTLPMHSSYDVVEMGARVWIQNYATRAVVNAARTVLPVPYYMTFVGTGAPTTQIGAANEVMGYAGEINNLGFENDTYQITVSGVPVGWAYSYTTPAGTFSGPSTLPLSGGEQAILTLELDSQGNPGSATVTVEVQSLTEPLNAASLEFTKLNGLDVLLVDDDNTVGSNQTGREIPYGQSLDAAGVSWARWDRIEWGAVSAEDFQHAAPIVMWVPGVTPSFDANDRTAITDYLAAGGKLFAAGTDMAYNLCDPLGAYYSAAAQAWFEDTFHAAYLRNIVPSIWTDGIPGDPIGDGLNPTLTNTPYYFGAGLDGISPAGGGSVAFTYRNQTDDAAVHFGGQVVYFAFGFENIADGGIRDVVMQRILEYLGTSTAIASPAAAAPAVALAQNVPNPFRPSTTITYTVGEAGPVSLRIYDVNGRLVRDLVETSQAASQYEVTWDGRDNAGRLAPAGVYFYRLEATGFEQTRRMVLTR